MNFREIDVMKPYPPQDPLIIEAVNLYENEIPHADNEDPYDWFYENRCFVVTGNNNQLLGVANLSTLGAEAHLLGITTVPEHRRQGVGTFMMNQLFEVATQADCSTLTLVTAHNDQAGFFARLGFENEEDGFHMELDLASRQPE